MCSDFSLKTITPSTSKYVAYVRQKKHRLVLHRIIISICCVYSVRCLAILLFKQEMPVIILESERFFIWFYIFPRGLGISRAYLVHITGERLVESSPKNDICIAMQMFTHTSHRSYN